MNEIMVIRTHFLSTNILFWYTSKTFKCKITALHYFLPVSKMYNSPSKNMLALQPRSAFFFFNLTLSQPPLCLSQLTRTHTAKEKHNPLRVFLLGHIDATLFAGALTAFPTFLITQSNLYTAGLALMPLAPLTPLTTTSWPTH
jgi:hypothetical protein